jgi:glucose-1-phosphate adenylyltransferase
MAYYKWHLTTCLIVIGKTGADITIAYRDMNDFLPDELSQLGIVKLNEEGRIIDLQEKPLHPESSLGSMAFI